MKPGIYTVQHDVPNPNGDRRQKHDWRHVSIWKKGLRLHVKEPALPEDCGELVMWSGWSHNTQRLSTVSAALIEAMQLSDTVRDRVSSALEQVNLEGWHVRALERLVERGDVTIDQVVSAAQEASDAPDNEED